MNVFTADTRQTIIVAILVLYLGKYLTYRIRFLQAFNIPDAVSGGILASILFGLIYILFQWQVAFSLNIRDAFLIIFFTTIGLSSRVETLLRGGRPLLILLVTAVMYLFIQNLTGLAMASWLGLPKILGLIAGSISLSGGHGTVIAWAPILQQDYGIANAPELGIASATFGLILGGLVGGPTAKFLILKHGLQTEHGGEDLTIGIRHHQAGVKIDYGTMLNSLLVLGITIGLGLKLNEIIADLGLRLPDFVACLLAGIIFTNTVPWLFQRFAWPAGTPSLALISDLSLGLFLAMSLMSLQLWTLAGMGVSMGLVLAAQLAVSIAYTVGFVFPIMGRNYDAAVIAAGYSGLTLGATPTAIANMNAVTQEFGASPQAFIILPLVGAFFIDISNALVIQRFLHLIG
ncbi:sodium/glutamate symporter [Gloeomargarita lithophora Alchichica-D10]|uniref:Sodium/glutamate symporter n=1 Tax=Gloeomargarita lithophora Alchichica-D10 TaxID=1188229 RepID=A0A1J0ACP9_9CYAN|nr:sodium/glutamate symporter [Gloeomargarita lithophora]APB33710.1 sodium/glutamate symporter [Gloeomargarita lithophora Alchichica-D10]